MPGVYTVTSVPHQKMASGEATNGIFRDLYQRSENVGFVAKIHIRRIPQIPGDLRHFLGGLLPIRNIQPTGVALGGESQPEAIVRWI
jgi:hypothetical protein